MHILDLLTREMQVQISSFQVFADKVPLFWVLIILISKTDEWLFWNTEFMEVYKTYHESIKNSFLSLKDLDHSGIPEPRIENDICHQKNKKKLILNINHCTTLLVFFILF